jgi:hypothetical protein
MESPADRRCSYAPTRGLATDPHVTFIVTVAREGRHLEDSMPGCPASDSEEFEDFVLTRAPEFIEGMATANAELAAGETVSLADGSQPSHARHLRSAPYSPVR